MSYCVNCGVKLDASLTRCPLCGTPVLNPNEFRLSAPSSPFPEEKGQAEVVKSRDLAILLLVVLLSTSAVCGLLNLLVFSRSAWSFYVIGACLLIGVLAFPAVIHTHFSIYCCLLCDGMAAAFYQYMISFNTSGREWFFRLALPLTAFVTVLAILFAFLVRKISSAFLMVALYCFLELAALCVGIELLIRHFLCLPLRLTWSAILLAICTVIVVALITLLALTPLRNEVRKRLHF